MTLGEKRLQMAIQKDFPTLTRRVLEVAKAHARGRLVSCLEGGYNVETLGELVQVHLEELLAFKG